MPYFSIKEILLNASENNVTLMLNIATKYDEFNALKETSDLYKNVYFTLGIHPHESNQLTDVVIKSIFENWNQGEGVSMLQLDYYYSHSEKRSQIKAFERQIEISQELNIPIIIHMRDAEVDTIKIIKDKLKKALFSGIIHCFTGSQKFADEAVELGFYISASGVTIYIYQKVGFKTIPLERLLVETDSPYLSPEPLRGKVNQPSHIIHTVSKLADLHKLSFDDMARQTKKNFLNLFNKIKE